MTKTESEFNAAFAAMMERCKDQQRTVVRLVAFDLASEMIQRSPVDTGRFKNNWYAGIGAINHTTNASTDKSGGQSLGRVRAALEGFEPGMKIYITNSLPYAKPLEHGHSKQAPTGMVGLTVQNYAAKLRLRLGQVK